MSLVNLFHRDQHHRLLGSPSARLPYPSLDVIQPTPSGSVVSVHSSVHDGVCKEQFFLVPVQVSEPAEFSFFCKSFYFKVIDIQCTQLNPLTAKVRFFRTHVFQETFWLNFQLFLEQSFPLYYVIPKI